MLLSRGVTPQQANFLSRVELLGNRCVCVRRGLRCVTCWHWLSISRHGAARHAARAMCALWRVLAWSQGNAAAVVVALVAFVASWAVLGFCAGLLLNVVDAVFVCFGIERDAHMCTRPEVRRVDG